MLINPDRPDECLICGSPLEYLDHAEEMTCSVCGQRFSDRARCINGHYVCGQCHMGGLDSIISVCRRETSKDPAAILDSLMSLPFCHMHGPEHHILVGASLLTAYRNSGGDVDFDRCLSEIVSRGRSIPGGACGYWGACGAAVSSGIFVSVISGSSPLAEEPFALSNRMTSRALGRIADVGGPRCCKRDSYLSIIEATAFVEENFGVKMETSDIICSRSSRNAQCIKERCPFFPRA